MCCPVWVIARVCDIVTAVPLGREQVTLLALPRQTPSNNMVTLGLVAISCWLLVGSSGLLPPPESRAESIVSCVPSAPRPWLLDTGARHRSKLGTVEN